eukprot:gene14214-20184_t
MDSQTLQGPGVEQGFSPHSSFHQAPSASSSAMPAPVKNTFVMAVHTMEVETARVPLAMIMLSDHFKRRSLPPHLHLRVMAPSGKVCISMWDAPSCEAVQDWLDENLSMDPGCTSTCHEVEEGFSIGLSLELARVRAAEK